MDDKLTNEVQENTIATQQNTLATVSVGGSGISRITAIVTGLLLAAVCFVSYIDPDFAKNQSGIIFSAIAGGLFGVSQTAKR